MNEIPILEVRNVYKSYKLDEVLIEVLHGISLKIFKGEFIAIQGASGSGKSTLLSILGCLDLPSSGEVYLKGQKVSDLSEAGLAKIRNRDIGFVFQNFNLLPYYDAFSNVELPLLYGGHSEAGKAAKNLLEKVGLGQRLRHLPSQLSGGQKQRVAIARALANRPSLLLADEPTGNLDSKTGQEILGLFRELHQQGGTIILVTHDNGVARHAKRTLRISDGRILEGRSSLFSEEA